MVSRNVVRILAALLLALALVACGGGAGPVGDDNGKTPAPGTYTVSGTVVDADDNALQGVTLGVAGSSTKTETDADGKWSLSDLTGTSVITPTHADYTFNPASQTVTKAASNINFIGTKTSGTTQLGITITASSETAGFEEPIELVATVTGDDAASAGITWTVDPNAGQLSENTGKEVAWTTPDNVGRYTITATATANGRTATDSVEVAVCDSGCIYTLEDLGNVRNDLMANYYVMNDIDASETQTDWGAEGFPPIGSETEPFTGTFDGQGYTISGLTIKTSNKDNVGLFGFVGRSGVIQDLNLEDVEVVGSERVGALVGTNNGGTITRANASGSIEGVSLIGGLAGFNENDGEIRNSSTHASVTARGNQSADIGGLVGKNEGTVAESSSAGDVSGYRTVGGLAGRNASSGEVIDSSSSSDVTGVHQAIGGLIGRDEGPVHGSFSTGNVSGNLDVGGLLGQHYNVPLSNSYSTGNVKGDGTQKKNIGGLIGSVYTSGAGPHNIHVTGAYSTGDVEGKSNVGGLIGRSFALNLEESYSEGKVTGTGNNVGGLIGYADTETKVFGTYSASIVKGFGNVGGLVGHNYRGIISQSYSLPHEATGPLDRDVTGWAYVGGLVGRNSHTIIDSYSWSSVSSSKEAGGLVGWNDTEGTIENSYSATVAVEGTQPYEGGLVGQGVNNAVVASYWDTESSGVFTSAGGTGKDTSEMQNPTTFSTWDTDIWEFPAGYYPNLKNNPRE